MHTREMYIGEGIICVADNGSVTRILSDRQLEKREEKKTQRNRSHIPQKRIQRDPWC